MTERTIAVEREVIEQASLAVRETAKALITLEETLKQPYPDDPRWSPWTRFIDRNEYSPWSLLAKADTALKAALSSDHQGGRGLSREEREWLGRIATKIGEEFDAEFPPHADARADIAFLRQLADQDGGS